MTEGEPTVETNRNIQVNWGTFNMPTLVGVVGLGLMVFNAGQAIQRQDGRITNIETSRAERQLAASKQSDLLAVNTASIANLAYRLTTLEANVSGNNIAINARADRQSDSIQDFRSDLAKVNTSIELLSQQIKILLPEKKAALGTTPPEYASK
jgi:hypothetical protein